MNLYYPDGGCHRGSPIVKNITIYVPRKSNLKSVEEFSLHYGEPVGYVQRLKIWRIDIKLNRFQLQSMQPLHLLYLLFILFYFFYYVLYNFNLFFFLIYITIFCFVSYCLNNILFYFLYFVLNYYFFLFYIIIFNFLFV